MLFRMLAWLMILPLPLLAQPLVRVSDACRYFKATNAPSRPPNAWQQIIFDDSTWLTSVGGFSKGLCPPHPLGFVA